MTLQSVTLMFLAVVLNLRQFINLVFSQVSHFDLLDTSVSFSCLRSFLWDEVIRKKDAVVRDESTAFISSKLLCVDVSLVLFIFCVVVLNL